MATTVVSFSPRPGLAGRRAGTPCVVDCLDDEEVLAQLQAGVLRRSASQSPSSETRIERLRSRVVQVLRAMTETDVVREHGSGEREEDRVVVRGAAAYERAPALRWLRCTASQRRCTAWTPPALVSESLALPVLELRR